MENKNLLDQLKEHTVVVSDTGDFNSIVKYRPRDATTNPSLLTAAAQMKEYYDVVDGTLSWARKQAGAGAKAEAIVPVAIDQLAVEFGLRILKIIPGRVSTEVDARLSHDTRGTIDKARAIIAAYDKAGVGRERVLVKIASSWEGIRAAEVLEKEGIHCNLTLLFGLHQAIACADAGATLISPFVGRILDWYLKEEKRDSYPPEQDPGVRNVTQIYNYYKHFGVRTEVMGASFRNIGEIIELCGCDLLTISPKLLEELSQKQGTLSRKLDPRKAEGMQVERLKMDEAAFRLAHQKDRMASEKLEQGIADFSKALVTLEELLAKRLAAQ
jgi:transaldolase